MNRIRGTWLFWLILAMVVYLIWLSPVTASHVLGDAGHAFVSIGNGIETFLDNLNV